MCFPVERLAPDHLSWRRYGAILDSMKSVQIKNVPDEVHDEIRRRAAMAGRSLQEYLLRLLTEEAGCQSIDELFSRDRRHRGGRMPLVRATELVRADRDSG